MLHFTFLSFYIRESDYFMMMFYGMDMDGCALHSQISGYVGSIFIEKGVFWAYVWV